jgi:hypothetical protein
MLTYADVYADVCCRFCVKSEKWGELDDSSESAKDEVWMYIYTYTYTYKYSELIYIYN